MGKRASYAIIGLIVLLLALSGCNKYSKPAETEEKPVESAEKTGIIASSPKNQNSAEQNSSITAEQKTQETTDDPAKTEEETAGNVPKEELSVTPVVEKQGYVTAQPNQPTGEVITCGCGFSWDPVCGNDGKTYINRCIFQCFGNDLKNIKSNTQCPKKQTNVDIYTDDLAIDYETDKENGGYCWRNMTKGMGLRRCDNLIVNGRANIGPAPTLGNWLDTRYVVDDKKARKDSYSIKLERGWKVVNEEYNTTFQPLFTKGRYTFSFWAREDAGSNNDWNVKLTLRDWNNQAPKPGGMKSCYTLTTQINSNEVYIETGPDEWRHYHFEFDVPLDLTQWSVYERESALCEYNWDMMPHGYRIEAEGPSFGRAYFDDFSLINNN
jgi:hypothetical protein